MHQKFILLGSAAALAVIYGASAAPVDTVIAPRVAVLETLTGLIRQFAQRPIFPKTMLAEGDGGAKYPVGWSKANLPTPALGGVKII